MIDIVENGHLVQEAFSKAWASSPDKKVSFWPTDTSYLGSCAPKSLFTAKLPFLFAEKGVDVDPLLNQLVEDQGFQAVRRLREQKGLDNKQRINAALWVALHMARTPGFDEYYAALIDAKGDQFLADISTGLWRAGSPTQSSDLADFREMTGKRTYRLQRMLALLPSLAVTIFRMSWHVITLHKPTLVLGGQPIMGVVLVQDPSSQAPRGEMVEPTECIELTFPLSPTQVVCMVWAKRPGPSYHNISFPDDAQVLAAISNRFQLQQHRRGLAWEPTSAPSFATGPVAQHAFSGFFEDYTPAVAADSTASKEAWVYANKIVTWDPMKRWDLIYRFRSKTPAPRVSKALALALEGRY
jgi:hypothetical protein